MQPLSAKVIRASTSDVAMEMMKGSRGDWPLATEGWQKCFLSFAIEAAAAAAARGPKLSSNGIAIAGGKTENEDVATGVFLLFLGMTCWSVGMRRLYETD